MFRKLKIVSTVAIALLCGMRHSQAAIAYDSAGFEGGGSPSRFTTGNLEGQDVTSGPWTVDNNVSSATVQTAVVQAGLQAVRIDRAASVNADQRWSVFKPTPPMLRYLTVSWDENVTRNTTTGVIHGPLFGVEAYDDTGGATVPLIGSSFVDATTGTLFYQASTTGNLTATGSSVTFGKWNHFDLQADFTTDTYQLFLNGSQVASDGFVDSGISGFTDAPLSTVAYPDNVTANLAASGTAYFDNYVVATSAATVPEPAVLGLFAMGIMILASRRII